MVETLKIKQLRRDGGTQSRAALDDDTVERYWQLVEEADEEKPDGVEYVYPFKDPVEVAYDGENYWLYDGFHRTEALEEYYGDECDIQANVTQGTVESAQWESFGANKAHGLHRSNADKRRAVIGALKHQFTDGTFGWQRSNGQIAKHTGVDKKTVGTIRGELEATGEIPQSTERIGGDGRVIETANIGGNATPDDATRFATEAEWSMPADWLEKIVKPWLANYPLDTVTPVIKRRNADDEDDYLILDPPGWIRSEYALVTSWIYPAGYEHGPLDVCKIDMGMYIEMKRSHPIVLETIERLPRDLQEFVVSIARDNRISMNKLTPLSFKVEPGQFVTDRQNHIYKVISVHPSHLRVRWEQREASVNNAYVQSVDRLGIQKEGVSSVYTVAPGDTWRERYDAMKQIFAPDSTLVVKVDGIAHVAVGDDAVRLAAEVGEGLQTIAPGMVAIFSTRWDVLQRTVAPDASVVCYRDDATDMKDFLNRILSENHDTDLDTIGAALVLHEQLVNLRRQIGKTRESLRDQLLLSADTMEGLITNSPTGRLIYHPPVKAEHNGHELVYDENDDDLYGDQEDELDYLDEDDDGDTVGLDWRDDYDADEIDDPELSDITG